MKAFAKYIFAAGAIVFFAASCQEKNPVEIEKANPGDEVVFGVNLPAKTKTVYGEETREGFPVYWVNGDKVKVASPQCLSGRNSAEYKVNVGTANQNYADALVKTGAYGIQWGDSENADFYSIYPSTAGTELTVSGNDVKARLQVAATQFAATTEGTNSFYAQPADMGNVIMYAKTEGVTSGQTVELHYTPFSTVVEFEITAPSQAQGNKQTNITIQTLTLTAPSKVTIAGDFDFTFPSADSSAPTVAPISGGSNSITMHFLDNNQYTTVLSTTKASLKAKMCLMPVSGVQNLEGWTIEVNTSAGTFKKTLTADNGTLGVGLVNKIKLPELNYASKEWVYDLANWMPSLPDYTNIYLSELSIPGAWYAGSTESYQATSDITTLWNAGVRAFAVECRSWSSDGTKSPSRVCLSGSGRNAATGAYVNPWLGSATMISSIISKVSTSIKSDEYAVLVLSYADGGDGGHRDSDHSYFLAGIANEITKSGASNIYTGPITANTTVADVLGKLIIKVNIDSNIPVGSYTGMNALLSYNPFLPQMSGADYTKPYYSDLYWSTWENSYKSYDLVSNLQAGTGNENSFVWVFSSANRTQADTETNTTIPTYAQRQTALEAMMTYSKSIYDASTHNVWLYFNCGGTQATSSTSSNTSPTTFASTMNSWLLNTINGKTEASPLGIVMFNQCTGDNDTYHGDDIIKAIIEMNSKFYLKHAGDGSGSTGGNTTPVAQNGSTLEDGGNAI